jgi:hypothetical protein
VTRALIAGVLALSLSAVAAPAKGKKLTLLFTGDNGAQVAPCG